MMYKKLNKREELNTMLNNPWFIRYIDKPREENQIIAVGRNPNLIVYFSNISEKVQLVALEKEWTKYFYESYIKDLPNKTDWFNREFNRLKLIKGPLK